MNCLKRMAAILLTMVLFFNFLPMDASAAEKEEILLGIGYVITSKLRLYHTADSDSEILDTATEGECVAVICETDDEDWYKVNFNLQEGYMLADCIVVESKLNTELGHGRVNSPIVYMRSGPGTEYSILQSGRRDQTYYILGIDNGWYRILNDNSTCYIRSDLMDLTEIPPENEASEEKPRFYCRGRIIDLPTFKECEPVQVAETGGYYAPVSGAGLLSIAAGYIGTPYVFGGTSPGGFDCSGLVYYALSKIGYPAARTAAGQYNMGYYVSRDELIPGDLVFFANTYTSGISHVGIYAGGGQFLHAPGDGQTVCYSSLSGYWSSHYYGARRLG